MPYTLAKFLLWGSSMALAGVLIGWMLRSLKARRQVAQARAATVDRDEVARLRRRLANLEPVVAERDRLRMELADVRGGSAGALGFAVVEAVASPPDVDAAAAVLGKKIKLDDLTVVEGIGPKISQLCQVIGIATWRQLAAADVADLQSMLDAGGPRFQMHKPGTWPQQAGLLADGRWDDFKQLTDDLNAGG